MLYKLSILGLILFFSFQSFGLKHNSNEFLANQTSHFNSTSSNSTTAILKQILIIEEIQEESSENDSDSNNDQVLIYFKSQFDFSPLQLFQLNLSISLSSFANFSQSLQKRTSISFFLLHHSLKIPAA